MLPGSLISQCVLAYSANLKITAKNEISGDVSTSWKKPSQHYPWSWLHWATQNSLWQYAEPKSISPYALFYFSWAQEQMIEYKDALHTKIECVVILLGQEDNAEGT